jgi:predicted amidohydrolase YtcJ
LQSDDFHRFKDLNCTAEMSPTCFFKHPITASNDLMDWNFSEMVKHNAHVTIGSDWIGNPPLSILAPCAGIVDDVGQGSRQKGGELLCKMLTLNGAEAVGWEKQTGSIAVGKKANFIAVNRDLSKGDFDGAEVLKTWFEGELVWEK